MHPNRLRFAHVLRRESADAAGQGAGGGGSRQPDSRCSPDNPLLPMEKAASSWITTCLESWGEMRDAHDRGVVPEHLWLAAAAGAGRARCAGQRTPRRIERDLVREAAAAELRSELEHRFEDGRPRGSARCAP